MLIINVFFLTSLMNWPSLNQDMRCSDAMLYVILTQADEINYLGKHK